MIRLELELRTSNSSAPASDQAQIIACNKLEKAKDNQARIRQIWLRQGDGYMIEDTRPIALMELTLPGTRAKGCVFISVQYIIYYC